MTRVESILETPDFTEFMKKNQSSEANRKFCRHTFQHLVDAARITYILMLESGDIRKFMRENGLDLKLARELIYAAALLHDIGRWKEYETGEDHSLVSAEIAKKMLKKASFNDREIIVIITAISEHRRADENASMLGRHLSRADNLSRLCSRCEASEQCHKYDIMETGHKVLIY